MRAADLPPRKRQRGQQGTAAPRWAIPAGGYKPEELSYVNNHTIVIKNYEETCSFAVTPFYLSIFRHMSYWCKLKQGYMWLALKGCLLFYWFRNKTF